MQRTQMIQKAMATAERLHSQQVSKISKKPYINHIYKVKDILSGHTKDENIICAGILHDVLEDVKDYDENDMRKEFGSVITEIVKEVTEDKDPEDIKEKSEKTWTITKQKYLDHLNEASYEALMVCAADKLSNLKLLYEVYIKQGDTIWSKFNASKGKIKWFNQEIIRILKQRLKSRIFDELENAYNTIGQKMFEDQTDSYCQLKSL